MLISISLTVVACKGKTDEVTSETPATEGQVTVPADGMTADPAATPGSQPATNSNEPHYKCSKAGCTGTGTDKGKCPVCGSDLVHNQAYHATQQLATPGTNADNAIQVNPSSGTTATPTTPPGTVQGQAVAQNSKGEYHYTCPKGHPGAAQAGNCAKCGEALTHNSKFHQE